MFSVKELKSINVAGPYNYLPNKNINLGTECDKYIQCFSSGTYEQVKNMWSEFYGYSCNTNLKKVTY